MPSSQALFVLRQVVTFRPVLDSSALRNAPKLLTARAGAGHGGCLKTRSEARIVPLFGLSVVSFPSPPALSQGERDTGCGYSCYDLNHSKGFETVSMPCSYRRNRRAGKVAI